jgi:hypothetical protein
LDALVQTALRTSEIDGEKLDATSVRSLLLVLYFLTRNLYALAVAQSALHDDFWLLVFTLIIANGVWYYQVPQGYLTVTKTFYGLNIASPLHCNL